MLPDLPFPLEKLLAEGQFDISKSTSSFSIQLTDASRRRCNLAVAGPWLLKRGLDCSCGRIVSVIIISQQGETIS